MKQLFLILITASIISCADSNKPGKEVESSTSAEVVKPIIPEDSIDVADQEWAGCYMKIVGRDTAILMLEQKGDQLGGKMLYDNFDKDGSQGTVSGKVDGEILKLWYDFHSEGVHSIMEAYFKKDKGRLLRGVGSMDVKTDTTYFISGINYSDKEAFNKVDCAPIKWKMEW